LAGVSSMVASSHAKIGNNNLYTLKQN
jgi:hypothetical protein